METVLPMNAVANGLVRMQTPKLQSSPTAAGAELCLHAQVFGPARAMGGTKAVARRRVIGACALSSKWEGAFA